MPSKRETVQEKDIRIKEKVPGFLSKTKDFLHGVPEGIRTPGLQSRSLTLYPTELRVQTCDIILCEKGKVNHHETAVLRRKLSALRIEGLIW